MTLGRFADMLLLHNKNQQQKNRSQVWPRKGVDMSELQAHCDTRTVNLALVRREWHTGK